jgi:hypothetical protein
MSASEERRGAWPDPAFWERLDLLEARHRRAQSEHHRVRRWLERLLPHQAEERHLAWRRYCEVIAELERATADFEALRSCVH